MKTANPPSPVVGYQYEAPMIGKLTSDNSLSTNVAPVAMALTLTANVTGLQPGSSYNLYRYQDTARSEAEAAAYWGTGA